jgi:hypothetical protein
MSIGAIISIILPIFGVIGLGWLARRFKILQKQAAVSLNNLVYYIALPFLIFQGIINLNRGDLLNWRLALTNVIALTVLMFGALFVTKVVLKLNPKTVAMFVIASYFGTVAYMGIPLNELAYGAEGRGIASLVSVIVVVFAILIGLSSLQLVTGDKGFRLQDAALKIIQHPIIWAAIAGAAITFSGIALPATVHNLVGLLARVAGPLALFSLGMFIYEEHKVDGEFKLISIIGLFNLIALPIVVFLVGRMVGLTGVPLKVSIIEAGVPVAVTTFVFSQKFQIEEKLISQAIVFTVLVSPITLAILLWLVERI